MLDTDDGDLAHRAGLGVGEQDLVAFHAIQPLAREVGAEIAWKPILVGGVFNAVNQTVYESRARPNPRKQAYMLQDLQAWARLYGLRIVFPPTVFPVNSVKCMRAAFHALDAGRLVPYATAAFEAYFGEDRDIARDDVLAEGIRAVGVLGAERPFLHLLETDRQHALGAAAADRLHHPEDDQPEDVGGQTAQQRPQRKDGNAADEHPPPPEVVADAPGGARRIKHGSFKQPLDGFSAPGLRNDSFGIAMIALRDLLCG